MTPGQGVGANTALRDASLLRRELTPVARQSKPLLTAIGDYESEMIPYGYFSVSSEVPALRRKFLADMYAYRGSETV